LKILNFENPRWRRPPYWKIEKSPYFGGGLTDFDKLLLDAGYIFETKVRIDNRKKIKQQYLPHMPLQYGELRPLAAEIVSLVWGTPANFNGFRVLAYCMALW